MLLSGAFWSVVDVHSWESVHEVCIARGCRGHIMGQVQWTHLIGACSKVVDQRSQIWRILPPYKGICIPRISADFFSANFSINRFFSPQCMCGWSAHPRGKNLAQSCNCLPRYGHRGTSWLCLCYSLTGITLNVVEDAGLIDWSEGSDDFIIGEGTEDFLNKSSGAAFGQKKKLLTYYRYFHSMVPDYNNSYNTANRKQN